MPVIKQLSFALLRRHLQSIVGIAADVPGEYWTADHFLSPRPRKFELSVIAFEGEHPVGYAIVSERSKDQAHLHHLMVRSTHRGAGLGADLLRTARARASLVGLHRLTLKVATTNLRAREFYARQGFVELAVDGDHAWAEASSSTVP